MTIAWSEWEKQGLTRRSVEAAVADHQGRMVPQLQRLWAYYRNPMRSHGHNAWTPSVRSSVRRYTQAQEQGLPARLTGAVRGGLGNEVLDERTRATREIVIENDIAWRVQAMVDFVFGKPVLIQSKARDAALRQRIERVLDHVWERSGGIALLQDMGTLGHVYGHVDALLRIDDLRLLQAGAGLAARGDAELDDVLEAAASGLAVELIKPTRGVALMDDHDYRRIAGYVVRAQVQTPAAPRGGVLAGLARAVGAGVVGTGGAADLGGSGELLELIAPGRWEIYESGRLTWQMTHDLTRGAMPVVHVQNISQPFCYEGISEVEALIPLQDELNTRLSDRASRVTLSSFKMYLAKGIEGFDKAVVGPGQVWYTDNMDASITSFGGDTSSPSEDEHIREIREAMDKVSGVPPLSGGVVQGRIGNLSSANALKVTLMGLIAKTDRKRVAYGRAMVELSRLMLVALHEAGILRTQEADRDVALSWPDPLPLDDGDAVASAAAKRDLGVPRERVLAELGYVGTDDGVT